MSDLMRLSQRVEEMTSPATTIQWGTLKDYQFERLERRGELPSDFERNQDQKVSWALNDIRKKTSSVQELWYLKEPEGRTYG